MSEVHQFLLQSPIRPPGKKIGSYAQVNLKGYQRVREDFQNYLSMAVPHVAETTPETFIKNVTPKLRAFGLTKTEVYTMINIGIGLPRGQAKQQLVNGNGHVNGDAIGDEEDATQYDESGAAGDEGDVEPTADAEPFVSADYSLIPAIIEEFGERFPGEEGQEQVQKILDTIREEYELAQNVQDSTNGDAAVHGDNDPMEVS